LFALGCTGQTKLVKISYSRPAEYQIPVTVKRLAVAQFVGKTNEDARWAHVASDRLVGALNAAGKRDKRYELCRPKRLEAIMDEHGLAPIADADSARKLGRLADADAIIYGTVSVVVRDQRGKRKNFAADAGAEEPFLKRCCLVDIRFTMNDVDTGGTIAAFAIPREYDSEKPGKRGQGVFDEVRSGRRGAGGPGSPQRVIRRLIGECVDAFVAKISPYYAQFTVELERGRDRIVRKGNALAQAGQYDDALDCYEIALARKAEDHGATFNAGVIYEAKGDLEKAGEMYGRAFRLEPKEKYAASRRRAARQLSGK